MLRKYTFKFCDDLRISVLASNHYLTKSFPSHLCQPSIRALQTKSQNTSEQLNTF